MNHDDIPGDHTIVMPTPGRRRDATAARPDAPAIPAADTGEPIGPAAGAHDNPLLAAAAPLLSAAARLRATPHHDDPAGLRASLVQAVKQFEKDLQQAGVSPEHALAARYLLCTLLDEAAADTPWGGNGVWVRQSLLVMFHNETWGGEKCFQLLARLAQDPAANRDLLELFHVCLAIGLEGRYRVQDGGRDQLAAVRERLWTMVARERGAAEADLSPHWRGVAAGRALRWHVPLWAMAGAAALGLAGVYAALLFALNAHSDPVFAALSNLKLSSAPLPVPVAPTVPATPAPSPKAQPRLAAFLEPEVRAGLVAVDDQADRSIVTLRGDGMFAPGSADIADRARPVLARIAAALQRTPGSVVITGHSDNQPIRSLRHPSNWELSRARAQAVQDIIGAIIAPERLRAEGRAEQEPVADNATPEGRARNRRVEITLNTAAQESRK